MKPIPENISQFISEHQVASVCFTDDEAKPYCISCFYVFDVESKTLVFKSSYGTKHDAYVKPGAPIAGTIVPKVINLMSLKGIQFNGQLLDKKETDDFKLNALYLKAFPMSLALPGYLWAVKLSFVKLTDNSLVFGNKTLWEYAK